MIKLGSAWTTSEKDKRWKIEVSDIVVGGFEMPPELKKAIEKKKLELNEEPPDDLIYNYMKY